MTTGMHFKVIGRNTADGGWSTWHFPTIDAANGFAEQQARYSRDEVHVLRLIGTWRAPVEWVPAHEDFEPEEATDDDA